VTHIQEAHRGTGAPHARIADLYSRRAGQLNATIDEMDRHSPRGLAGQLASANRRMCSSTAATRREIPAGSSKDA